ncbi:MAG: peptidoglycan bridge formation glycyltransferase FemA/FemB family protein [Candidatus Moraniibacteriota bacterium]
MKEKKIAESVQKNSPAGEFLQSNEWQKFQESVGRKTFHLSGENFWANIIEHKLPIVGKYFYIPRGPIFPISNFQFPILNQIQSSNDEISKGMQELFDLAKKNSAGWIRIDPASEEILKVIRENVQYEITKAPHDMQPKEIFVIDITKSEEELLVEMKAKTRYNIRLAEKKGVTANSEQRIANSKNVEEFLRLTSVMAKRQGIVAHPGSYYRKMLEMIPGDILRLYVAEFDGRVIAANLVVFYGDTCIYLHGASDDDSRSVMAPYLLQWKQIRDAKKKGYAKYDLGGISMNYELDTNVRITNKWQGITKFKTGFSPKTVPTSFPGSYDIILDNKKYLVYKILQKLKNIL